MLTKGFGYLLAALAVAGIAVLVLAPAPAPADPTTAHSEPPGPELPSAASSEPADPPPSTTPRGPVGDRVHISGCDFGDLKVPVVDLWDSAEQTRVVGDVAGDGPPAQGLRCLGALVIVRAVDTSRPTTMYEVETVVGNQRGWVSDRFIGPTFDISLCGSLFSHSSAAAGKCRG